MMSYSKDRRCLTRMDSVGSNSDSDLSDFSIDTPQPFRARHISRGSIASVSTNPDEDAYVMVLQNKIGLYENLKSMTSLRDLYDVTFLVGEEQTPVHGVRALLATRSRAFHDLIIAHQDRLATKRRTKSSFRKAFNKLGKLACVRNGTGNSRLTIPMETYDAQSFQRLMVYIHTGKLTVDSSTVVGLLNAGYQFGLKEMLKACWNFALGCVVREDNMQDLFESVKRYKDQKMTTKLMTAIRFHQHEFPSILSHSGIMADFTSALTVDEEEEYTDSMEDSDSSAMIP